MLAYGSGLSAVCTFSTLKGLYVLNMSFGCMGGCQVREFRNYRSSRTCKSSLNSTMTQPKHCRFDSDPSGTRDRVPKLLGSIFKW